MQKYKLSIAYEGTHYAGWQIQDNVTTIQGLIKGSIEKVLKEKITLIGCSRTDSGVHALNQVAHFRTEQNFDTKVLFKALNAMLPRDIRITSLEEAPLDFHAQLSAKGKIYHYEISQKPFVMPFQRYYTYHCPFLLDYELLIKASQKFVGTHDFSAFANAASQGAAKKNPVRTLCRLDVKKTETGIRLEFEGNGFLYKMVRNITGTLIEVGRGKVHIDEIDHIFESKDRRRAPRAAKAQGLTLIKILY